MKKIILISLFLSICQFSMAAIELFCIIVAPDDPDQAQSFDPMTAGLMYEFNGSDGPTLYAGLMHEFHWQLEAESTTVPEKITIEYRFNGPESENGILSLEEWNQASTWDDSSWRPIIGDSLPGNSIPFFYPEPNIPVSKYQWKIPNELCNKTIYLRWRNVDNPDDFVVCHFPVERFGWDSDDPTAGKTEDEQVAGLLEESTSLNIKVFPNPVVDQLNIYLENDPCLETIEIYNTAGRLVKEWRLEAVRQEQFDLSDLESGVYILRVNGIESRRILKQ